MAVNRFASRMTALLGFLFFRVGIAISGRESDELLAPSITAGTAAPTATTEAEGSLYIRVSGTVGIYQYRSSAWVLVAGVGSDLGASVKADAVVESTSGADVTILHPRFGTAAALTIASGAVAATQVHHTLDTEGAAASDDLDSITGGANGDVLLVRLVNAARNVVLKHAVGANLIACPGGRDITLDVLTDWALLAWNGTQWTVVAFSTIATGAGGIGSALASTSTGLGAALVGIEDSAALITATTVEAALAEHQLRIPTNPITDPGNAGAIPVTRSGYCAMTSAGAETRTLAIPSYRGQRILLYDSVHVGNIVVTSAQALNQTGNTVMTFGAVRDNCELVAIDVGGALRWQVAYNDGVALS